MINLTLNQFLLMLEYEDYCYYPPEDTIIRVFDPGEEEYKLVRHVQMNNGELVVIFETRYECIIAFSECVKVEIFKRKLVTTITI